MKTDLIYGVEDRPPFKRRPVCGFTTSLGYFRSNYHTAAYHSKYLETGCRKDKLSSFHVPFLLREYLPLYNAVVSVR